MNRIIKEMIEDHKQVDPFGKIMDWMIIVLTMVLVGVTVWVMAT